MLLKNILIVDDEPIILDFLTEALKRKKFTLFRATDGAEALKIIKNNQIDLVITDLKMPKKNGFEVLDFAKRKNKNTIVIIMTAYGTIENAVESIKMGAFNYLIKPFSVDSLYALIDKTKEHFSLVQENIFLKKEILKNSSKYCHIIADSDEMKNILKNLERIAKTSASVFIFGESGTGKEVIAQRIHYLSKRKNNPFIKVNCAAIPDTLIESEFFGHEKGSFTGASFQKKGRFELANTGSLLLDEISEIPIFLQSKLLRAIQEMEFERVGGEKSIKVDIRFIATSNKNMKQAIENSTFRKDLFYRLNVVPIYLPPLRERKKDILALTNYFITRFCIQNQKKEKKITTKAVEKLINYSWPGNVRELANTIERTVVLDFDNTIDENHLFFDNFEKFAKTNNNNISIKIGTTCMDAEKELLVSTLKAQSNNKTKTAKILGISLKTLRNKIKSYSKTFKNS